MVIVLYRLGGKAAVNGKNGFRDVQDGQWYTDTVIWASDNKIIFGYGDGLFVTNDNITREQIVVILLTTQDTKVTT